MFLEKLIILYMTNLAMHALAQEPGPGGHELCLGHHFFIPVLIFFLSLFVFVCLGFYVPLENFFTHTETSPLAAKGFKF